MSATQQGRPFLSVGPLRLSVVEDPAMPPNLVKLQAEQTVKMHFTEDLFALIAGGIHGRVQARQQQRNAPYLIQSDDDWCEELMEAVGDVLAHEGDREGLRRTLIDMCAVAADWAIALDHRPTALEG